MESKFSIGDIVLYDDNLYRVIKLYAPNWNLDNPFVYGLALIKSDPKEPVDGKLLTVREPLLYPVSGTWKVLYGKD